MASANKPNIRWAFVMLAVTIGTVVATQQQDFLFDASSEDEGQMQVSEHIEIQFLFDELIRSVIGIDLSTLVVMFG